MKPKKLIKLFAIIYGTVPVPVRVVVPIRDAAIQINNS
jgi:hypothetical protein